MDFKLLCVDSICMYKRHIHMVYIYIQLLYRRVPIDESGVHNASKSSWLDRLSRSWGAVIYWLFFYSGSRLQNAPQTYRYHDRLPQFIRHVIGRARAPAPGHLRHQRRRWSREILVHFKRNWFVALTLSTPWSDFVSEVYTKSLLFVIKKNNN